MEVQPPYIASMTNPRLRFAPSPTGHLHIGGARSALFNYLLAKKWNGTFIVRIEDTDRDRSTKEFEDDIMRGLLWLGIKPDESPLREGPLGPYRQSERREYYTSVLQRLLEKKIAFYCPHDEKKAKDRKNPAPHWCEYRDGGGESAGIIRFKTPKDEEIIFADLIRGEIRTKTNEIGDFSIAKSVELPLYNLANVVDDHAMQISHVMRGEDHIANAPKQILLQKSLGSESQEYGPLPLILGPDRAKLSKRHGATSSLEFQKDYLPEALVNFLALLGWNPGTEQEIFSLDELIQQFSVERIHKAGAIFDFKKLDWMNAEYIRRVPTETLAKIIAPHLSTNISKRIAAEPEYLERALDVEKSRLRRLSEASEALDLYLNEPKFDREILRWKSLGWDAIRKSLKKSAEIIRQLNTAPTIEEASTLLLELANQCQDRGEILWPLRVSLTGRKASASPFEIISVLGREESLRRLEKTIAALVNLN